MGMENSIHRFGCHVSVAGGVSNAFERAIDIGCDAIQIFSKNQKQWNPKPFDNEEILRYHQEKSRTGIGPVMIHDSYLINLCATRQEILDKSRTAFADEIERAITLKADYLNFHPGAHLEKDEEWGIKTIAESINICMDNFPDADVKLLLETTAGQGTSIGYRFEQLRDIMNLVERHKSMGVCVDTAHIFAGGYDIRDEKSYEMTMNKMDEIIGLENVLAFHINDSKKDLGSRVDRHENLGEGLIGLQAFELLLSDERHTGKPMLLETPGGEEFFKKNIKIMRRLIGAQQ
jgi:deoxyribonuclease-4